MGQELKAMDTWQNRMVSFVLEVDLLVHGGLRVGNLAQWYMY